MKPETKGGRRNACEAHPPHATEQRELALNEDEESGHSARTGAAVDLKTIEKKSGHEVKGVRTEKQKRVPTSEPAKRIALLFRRRLDTSWDKKEVRRFRELVKARCFETLNDLALLERYYFFERKKGEKGFHRRDLYTLLNHWHGELDRAKEWEESRPVKSDPRKIIPMPMTELPYIAPTDPETLEAISRFERERERRSTFQRCKKEMEQ